MAASRISVFSFRRSHEAVHCFRSKNIVGPSHGRRVRLLFASTHCTGNPRSGKPPINVPSAPPAPASSEGQQSCPPLSIRANRTIEAELGMMLDSNDQEPGKKFWINSLYETDFHACRMRQGGDVFGSVTGAASSNGPRHSEMSLEFDAVDCVGHSKQPMNLVVIGVYVPPSGQSRIHGSVPTELQRSTRQISSTVAAKDGHDAILNGKPSAVNPGAVEGCKKVTLEPQGGPHCSSRLVSTDPGLVLAPGTIILLALQRRNNAWLFWRLKG
jgi:hypothetical protein